MTIFNGNPDRIIGDHYLERYYVIPRNRWFSVYLHKFLGSDDDRACHDHPWASVSFLLAGRLIELTPYDSAEMCEVFPETEVLRGRHIPWLWPVFRKATHTHRMVLSGGQPTHCSSPARKCASGDSFVPRVGNTGR